MESLRNLQIRLRLKKLWLWWPLDFMECGGALLASIILGTLLAYGAFYPLLNPEVILISVGLFLLVLYGIYGIKGIQKKDCLRWLLVYGLVSFSLVEMAYNHQTSLILDYQASSQVLVGKDRIYKGILLEEGHPIRDGNHWVYRVACGAQSIQVTSLGQATVHEGDPVLVKGSGRFPDLTEDLGAINKRARAMSDSLVAKVYEGAIDVDPQGKGSSWRRWVGYIHRNVSATLDKKLPQNLAYLANSLVLGGHYYDLDGDLLAAFSFTGLIHILSVSGSHIALLSALSYGLLKLLGLSKRQALYGVMLILLAYALVVGFNPPVVRSLLMGVLLAFGLIEGRLYQARQALHLCGIGLLLYNPFLLFDVSFQLSFGATYGIILFFKPLYQLLGTLPRVLRAPLSLCLAAQILIIPLQLYYFHYVSLVSLLAAILVAPILDLVILLVLLGLLGSICLSLQPLWWLIKELLVLNSWLIQALAHMPYAYFWTGIQPLPLTALYLSTCRLAYANWVQIHRPMNSISLAIALCLPLWIVVTAYYNHHHQGTIIHTIPMKMVIASWIINEDNRLLVLLSNQPDRDHVYSYKAIENALHAYGYDKATMVISNVIPSYGQWELKKSSFHWLDKSGEKGSFYIEGKEGSYAVVHGQKGQKIIQYLNDKDLFVTTDSMPFIESLEASSKGLSEGQVIYSPTIFTRDSIEPDEDTIDIVGKEYVEDRVITI